MKDNNDTEFKIIPIKEAIKIALIYLIISIIWILSSDYFLLKVISQDTILIKKIQNYKGVFFLLGNSLVLFYLVYDRIIEVINIRVELDRNNKLIKNVLKHSSLVIIFTDVDCNIVNVSPYFEKLTKYSKAEVIGKTLNEVLKEDSKDYSYIKEELKQGETINKLDVNFVCKDDEIKNLLFSISPIYDKRGEVEGFVAVALDVTEQRTLEKQILYHGSHDIMTGLPNWSLLEVHFNKLIGKLHQKNEVAFLHIDIDNFTQVNETLGYFAGDKLIQHIGEILKKGKGKDDLLSRLTQDDFGLILTNVKSEKDLERRIKRIQKEIHKPWTFEGHEFFIYTTIGIALYPKDADNFNSLLKNSNIALDYAKNTNRGEHAFYSKDMEKQIIDNLKFKSDIQKAIKEKEFKLNYQFIIDLKRKKVAGVEALIRWFHPGKGYIHPMDFIPLAEKSNLIIDITDYVINTGLKQMVKWREEGYVIPKIAINISPKSMVTKGFCYYIEDKLREYKIKSKELILELTESAFVEDLTNIKENIKYLRKIGVEISLDDFGTGYSTLSRLKDLKLDYLKLDRSFIMNMTKDSNEQALVKSVIEFANILDMRVCAEGVETEEQLKLLTDMGCSLGQGYYIHKPEETLPISLSI